MDLNTEIRKLVELGLHPDQFIVDIIASSKAGPKKITVVVDADQGMGIDDCAAISRRLSKALDESELIHDDYLLEVSTPGLEHPLKLKRQYNKNIGRKLKVKLREKTVEGKLTEVGEDKIILACEMGIEKKKEIETVTIPFSEIDKAFVMISFK